ncbi:MAG: 2'-deoxycytidine 5'-triphosphate deaminase domain-containing protein [Bryobacteraceae bacterium]
MEPWSLWIPGVLNKSQMWDLVEKGRITRRGGTAITPEDLDHSSLDLSLSDEAYEMLPGAVKPVENQPYGWFIQNSGLAKRLDPQSGVFSLREKGTYVFKLNERLERNLTELEIHGQATAKSSVGRVDVLTRLIVDGMVTYESFDPKGLARGSGDMYLEITPITFPVKVRVGASLSQLRLFYGNPSDVEIRSKVLYQTIFGDERKSDGTLSVDLQNTHIGDIEAAAICARVGKTLEPVPLWKEEPRPDPCRYWSLKESTHDRLIIETENFYLLRSREHISIPAGVAVYCRASDETIGEMRIHYAGFVHPWWGLKRKDGERGTPLIFEVRGHQVNVSLAHGERMANLSFYRMSQDAPEADPTPYEEQTLNLSKFFGPWPEKMVRSADGGLQTA